MMRRRWLALPLLAMLWTGCAARAQEYPTRPMRLVVNLAPGGAADVLARLVGAKLTERWGQPVVIDSRPGASGMLASELVAKSAADGYTLMLTLLNDVIAAGLFPNLPYDMERDFTEVAQLAVSTFVLAVHPAVPARSVAELVALARSRPGTLSYGSAGTGSTSHLVGVVLEQQAGISLLHVPYRGAAPSANDTVAGQLNMTFMNTLVALPLVRDGRVRALAVTAPRRLEAAPEIPTMAEAGFPQVEMLVWFGIKGPGGMPQPVVRRLSEALVAIIRQPDVQAQLVTLGATAAPMEAEEFGRHTRAELRRWTEIVRRAGVTPAD